VVGNSSTTDSTFLNQQTFTVSVSGGISIPGFSAGVTVTYSNDYTEEADTSTSIAVSKTTSLGTEINGVETSAGTNHDYDIIRVWLNPIHTYVLGPNSNQVAWTGYAYDLSDSDAYPYMEVVEVKMGCFNGHIPASDANCSYFFGRAQRTWALNNVDGSGSGLTGTGSACVPGSGSDICNILAADPFSDPNYTITFVPPSLTTADGRFTACHNNPNCTQTISCVPGTSTSYSQGYSNTDTNSQSAKYTYSETYSVQSEVKAGFKAVFSANQKDTNTITTSTKFSQSTNSSQGQTASFTIRPSSSYIGPQGFDVYQDNVFGTFVFWPIPQ
jgi:hypothetical protein